MGDILAEECGGVRKFDKIVFYLGNEDEFQHQLMKSRLTVFCVEIL